MKNRMREHRKQNKKSRMHDDNDDDFTVTTADNKKDYLKNCIKKRLNNNYVKQINCVQDENVIFTDNKIYVSLAARNSLTSSDNNSLKKNRRVIYPSSVGYKIKGFLRDYDFNYESPTKTSGSTSPVNEEKLKFTVMNPSSSLNSVVFEKVKVPLSKKATNDYTKSTLINSSGYSVDISSYEADDEDDVQWNNFLEFRKHGKTEDQACHKKMALSDSGFGSQLLSNSFSVDKNIKTADQSSTVDDEIYDNSFNEELERRVSDMFPNLCNKSFEVISAPKV